MIYVNTTPEAMEHWDRIINTAGEEEFVPQEFPHGIGDFRYFVVPRGLLMASHATGGYDVISDEEIQSTIVVCDEIPKEARPFWVAHLVMHKALSDDGSPHLCVSHDRCIQDFLSSTEPGLMRPYYIESTTAYSQGKSWYERHPGNMIEIERYNKALWHSNRKRSDALDADSNRARLEAIGLVLPDEEFALSAVDRTTGARTTISRQIEAGKRHKCKSCSHPITRGAERITTSTRSQVNGYDHHHFHIGCFSHIALGVFGDFHQTQPFHPHGK